jgi:hypothetical protein
MMPWTATHRWVFPSFSLVNSETRTPDGNWEHGYSQRQYVDSLWLAFVNGTWQPISVVATFWDPSAQWYAEFMLGGTLAGHESDAVRLLDQPGLPLPQLGTATSADVFQQWLGWFEVYASGDLQVAAWNEVFDKGATEIHGHTHIRTLDGYPAAMPRPDHLDDFPDLIGRPSQVWNSQRAHTNPPPPPVEDPRCPGLRDTIASLRAEVADLRAQLSDAQPGERQGLTAKIKQRQAQLTSSIQQALAAGCR